MFTQLDGKASYLVPASAGTCLAQTPFVRDSTLQGGEIVHSARHFGRISPRISSLAVARDTTAKVRLRARLCPAVLLAADLGAFAVASFLAFALDIAHDISPYHRAIANVSTLGAGWNGWGTLLVLVSLLCYFASRGHYTSRVPSWTQLADVVLATTVALACDIFLTVAIYDHPVLLEGLLRWVLYCPSLLLLRCVARQLLRAGGLWSLHTLIIATPGELPTAEAALVSDPALGYSIVGTITPAHAGNIRSICAPRPRNLRPYTRTQYWPGFCTACVSKAAALP